MIDGGIVIAVEKAAEYTGILVTGTKQDLINHLKFRLGDPLPTSGTLLTIQLSCGSSIPYKTEDDIPDHDVPCPCGDPKHWMIRYQQREGAGT